MENERKKLGVKMECFPRRVRDKLQLVYRFFESFTQECDEVIRHARITPSRGEIESAFLELKDGKKPLVSGIIKDGFFVDENDFFAIYEAICEVLGEASKLEKADMNTP